MRIIAGKFKNLVFDSPQSFKSHPMSERARGALFNILGDISGKTVLDGFAGSGALGLEALSRGASKVVFVEKDHKAATVIKSNVSKLDEAVDARVYKQNLSSWISDNKELKFDIILLDPPYNDLQLSTVGSVISC